MAACWAGRWRGLVTIVRCVVLALQPLPYCTAAASCQRVYAAGAAGLLPACCAARDLAVPTAAAGRCGRCSRCWDLLTAVDGAAAPAVALCYGPAGCGRLSPGGRTHQAALQRCRAACRRAEGLGRWALLRRPGGQHGARFCAAGASVTGRLLLLLLLLGGDCWLRCCCCCCCCCCCW
jgi:hypothetical protein